MSFERNPESLQKTRPKIGIRSLLVLSIFLAIGASLAYLFWRKPLAQPLELPEVNAQRFSIPPLTASLEPDTITLPQPTESTKAPLCGQEANWIILLAGLDYELPDPNYLYGLADVVRIIRIDFTEASANIISLPRALLVSIPPERMDIPGPLLLNQAYFYGASGMGHFLGTGFGAGSLAETIQYNFGISTDHYLVVNFQAFTDFIDAIGGIDINLPTFIDDRPHALFPAGEQHLNGSQTLSLARAREKYSDLIRINDQSFIIEAIFQKLKQPATFAKLPVIYTALKNSVLTDVSPSQIETAVCLFTKMEKENLHFFDPSSELMSYEWAYVPTLKRKMDVFLWDRNLIEWLHQSLWSEN